MILNCKILLKNLDIAKHVKYIGLQDVLIVVNVIIVWKFLITSKDKIYFIINLIFVFFIYIYNLFLAVLGKIKKNLLL